MAAYPSYPQVIGSVRQLVDDLTVDVAVDGSARGRAFYTTPKYRMRLMHRLDPTDLDALIAFYVAQRAAASVDVQWKCNGPVYACVFEGPPQISDENPLANVEVALRQV